MVNHEEAYIGKLDQLASRMGSITNYCLGISTVDFSHLPLWIFQSFQDATTLSDAADVLARVGRWEQASALMDESLSMLEVHEQQLKRAVDALQGVSQ